MKKLAMLRENSIAPCPFGLSIPTACKEAGDVIKTLSLLELGGNAEKNKSLVKNNSDKKECFYANKIIEGDNQFVECEAPFDVQPGSHFPVGSPRYYKPMGGSGNEGLNTVPLGYYNDNSLDRGYYYGMYSVESIANFLNEELEKFAKKQKKEDNNNHSGERLNVIQPKKNYDYGEGFYFGDMSEKGSVEEFLKKKRKEWKEKKSEENSIILKEIQAALKKQL